ncbi:nitroreductase family deazaflavin-dependent oxidoreductase [Nocardia cyriacigeorgica]|uniref:nitroreductase family deazaflavin-dependent oxidoreductase n=1 Tax=Nocardia cyriacigeorgica TaxID=135487 RepID=UPI001C499A6D|nr:nitroreductase family deazaflavin-dependent oxidoreductase [Nocardia cyriacigeorgica]
MVTKATISLGSRPWFLAAMKKKVPFDRAVYRLTRGRVNVMMGSGCTGLLLTTTGRRTGRPRSVPLLYIADGGRYYVTGSNWGGPRHPEWSANLLADPEAVASIKGRRVSVTARLLEAEERERIWSNLAAVWPNYDRNAALGTRVPRVFALTPR